jgi:hypothetical protein
MKATTKKPAPATRQEREIRRSMAKLRRERRLAPELYSLKLAIGTHAMAQEARRRHEDKRTGILRNVLTHRFHHADASQMRAALAVSLGSSRAATALRGM